MTTEQRLNRLENHVDTLNFLTYHLLLQLNANKPTLTHDHRGSIDGINSGWNYQNISQLLDKSRSMPFISGS